VRELQEAPEGEPGGRQSRTNAMIKEEVTAAHALQTKRQSKLNGEMTSREAREMTQINTEARSFLAALDTSHISPRGYYRLIKVARTIADLDGSMAITPEHLAEAFSYRLKEIF
jgi:magnesium chelatase family protein